MKFADFLKQEQSVVDQCLLAKHGYELVWLGADLISGANISPIKRKIRAVFWDSEEKSFQCAKSKSDKADGRLSLGFDLILDPESFPFEQNSIDFIVLSHVLEFQKNPEILLKEIHRVLRPDGALLVTGFSSWWFWRGTVRKYLKKMLLTQILGEDGLGVESTGSMSKRVVPSRPKKIALYSRGFRRLHQVYLRRFKLKKLYFFGTSFKIFSRGYALLLEKQTIKLRPIVKERVLESSVSSVFGVEVLDPKPLPSKSSEQLN